MNAAGTWSVFIAADNPELERVYRMASGAAIWEVMQKWCDDVKLFGNWFFASDNSETVFEDFMTLEMIGETSRNSKIVTLRAVLAPQPRPLETIFAYSDDECKQISVKPHTQLRFILRDMRSRTYEYNGTPLDWQHTVEQAGLAAGAVISSSQTRIAVRLSTGAVLSLSLPANSLVLHLQECVSRLEREECSLRYCGRDLCLDESVRMFKRPVDVVRTKFTVFLGHQRWTWMARNGAIKFEEFIARLSEESNLQMTELQDLTYSCTGCNRSVSRALSEFQVVRVQCCHQESMTLIAQYPTEKIGKMTQTAVKLQEKGVQCEPETAGKMTQTAVKWQEKEVQCKPETAEFSIQTAFNGRNEAVQTQWISKTKNISTQTVADQQHKAVQTPHSKSEFSTNDLIAIPLRVYNWTDTGLYQGEWRNVDIELEPKPTVGQLRTAVALLLDRLSQNTMMERCVGVSYDGDRVFDVWDKDGPFTCAAGRLFKWSEVKDVSYERLDDDDAIFIIPQGRRIKLEVHPC